MATLEEIKKQHKPVLVNEVLSAFGLEGESFAHLKKRLKIIDATLGLGGHTEEFVKRGIMVLGIDGDNDMLDLATKRLNLACPVSEYDTREPNRKSEVLNTKSLVYYKLVKGNFKDIQSIASKNDFSESDGVLFDLGVSSPQIVSRTRGISFQDDTAMLDMRLNREENAIKGSDLLNVLRYDQLFEMFSNVMPRSEAKKLASEVIEFRKVGPFVTVGDFKQIISGIIPKRGKKSPETLPFLALRIAVNSELQNISEGLTGAINVLRPKGRIVVISFHSGEDSMVNKMFKQFEKLGLGKQVTKKPVVPTNEEVVDNVRSRSALLRIFEKYE